MSTDEDYRYALSTFATGVAIVCARFEDRDYALTINSFVSVSLQPRLLLWSLQNDSRAYDIYSEAEFFSISILSDRQQALSDRYAQSKDFRLLKEDRGSGQQDLPAIAGAQAVFECKAVQKIAAGDHQLILAEVLGFSAKRTDNQKPLLFYKSGYKSLT